MQERTVWWKDMRGELQTLLHTTHDDFPQPSPPIAVNKTTAFISRAQPTDAVEPARSIELALHNLAKNSALMQF
jgi:hypothetical protein